MHAKQSDTGDIIIKRAPIEKILIGMVLLGLSGSIGVSANTNRQVSVRDARQNERLGVLEEKVEKIDQIGLDLGEIKTSQARLDERMIHAQRSLNRLIGDSP